MSEKPAVPVREEFQKIYGQGRELKITVVTSDAGVVEGLFTTYEDALCWARQHRMDIPNLREGFVTERDGTTRVWASYGA
jgi:hypothetical protein